MSIVFVAMPAMASDPPTQSSDLVYIETDAQINVVQLSMGAYELDGATATRDGSISGTGIRKAYLVWGGLGRDIDGVLLQRDAETPVAVVPDSMWNCRALDELCQ